MPLRHFNLLDNPPTTLFKYMVLQTVIADVPRESLHGPSNCTPSGHPIPQLPVPLICWKYFNDSSACPLDDDSLPIMNYGSFQPGLNPYILILISTSKDHSQLLDLTDLVFRISIYWVENATYLLHMTVD